MDVCNKDDDDDDNSYDEDVDLINHNQIDLNDYTDEEDFLMHN